jgi:acyl-CoA reductase-like NAD-dependent aldehyde dehydrogenase
MSNDREKIFVDGSWIASTGTGRLEVTNAATEQVMGSIPDGSAEDVAKAVAAAKAAFPGWAATSREERGKYLTRIAEELTARTDEIAELVAQEVGTPVWLAKAIQVGLPAAAFGAQAGFLDAMTEEETIGNAVIAREPVGVVGAITPWNYPLHQIAAKVAPALAAGCTVVVKPSEVAPLNAFVLAEIVESVGLPAGVFNLVTGVGPVVGEAIAVHPDVDMVSFTGSTLAGKRVMELASQSVKRVSLELGGKSPLIVMPDADPAAAAARSVQAAYLNSGQTCSALTRMVAPRAKLAEIEAAVIATVDAIKTGDPFGEGVFLGPLISERQGTGCRATSSSAPRRARASSSAARASPTAWRPATSSSRRSSPTSPRRCASRRRRSSARCWSSSPTTPSRRPSRSPTTPSTASPAACSATTRTRR